MGIAQIALDPLPPPLSNRQTWEKVLQTIPASPYTLGQTWEKSDPNHPGKPFHPPPLLSGNAHMETAHFKKGLPFAMKETEAQYC